MSNLLHSGFCYLELKEFKTTDKQGGPLKSAQSEAMVCLVFNAVDMQGNSGTIYEYVIFNAKFQWKINNLKNAFRVKAITQQEFRIGSCAAGTLVPSEYNGVIHPKIRSYVPLAFWDIVSEDIRSGGVASGADTPKKTQRYQGNYGPPQMSNPPTPKAQEPLHKPLEDFDDIPF